MPRSGGRHERSKKARKKGPWKGFILLMAYVAAMAVLLLGVLPAVQASVGPNQPSSADVATMHRAESTAGGKQLKEAGYVPDSVISEPRIVDFLDEQVHKFLNVTNPGPYVVFAEPDRPILQYPDPAKVSADQVVDLKSGTIVALKQDFKAKDARSGRGAICYAANMDDLARGWEVLNEQNGYLRGKSMPMQVPVNRDLVPKLPEKFQETNCFVYSS